MADHSFFKPKLAVGKYQILSNVVHDEENLLVIKRGKQIELAHIPTAILSVGNDARVLEIKEAGGFRNVIARPALAASEPDDIANYKPPGPTPR